VILCSLFIIFDPMQEDQRTDSKFEPLITTINTTDGKEKLYWKSWKPKQEPIGTVTLVHGLSEHCGRYDFMFEEFAESGLVVNCFDLRGHGHTTGIRGHTPFKESFEDISLLISKADPKLPHIIYGHSLGGLLVLGWIHRRITEKNLPPIAGVVVTGPLLRLTKPIPGMGFISSVANSLVPFKTLKAGIDPKQITRDPEQVELYKNDPFNAGLISCQTIRHFLTEGTEVLSKAREFTLPVLLMHGGSDQVNDPKTTEAYFNTITSTDKTLKIFEGAYHELHREIEEVRLETIRLIKGWILQHVKTEDTH